MSKNGKQRTQPLKGTQAKAKQAATKRLKGLDAAMPLLGAGMFGPGGAEAGLVTRELLHDLTGFNSRKMRTTEQRPKDRKAASGVSRAGGSIVTTQSAPVAFPRRPASVGTTRSTNPDGSTRIHVHDLVEAVQTGPTASTFNVLLNSGILATSTTAFPNTWNEFQNFDRWKLRALRLHYDHFAPTSTQASVGLLWVPDAATANPASTSVASAYKNVEVGACYEDFCMEVDPKDLERSAAEWYYNDSTAASGVDTRFNEVGTMIIFTDNNVPTSTRIGLLYIEAIIDVCDQRPASVGTGLIHKAERHLSYQTDKRKREQVILSTLQGIRKTLEARVPKVPGPVDFANFLESLSDPTATDAVVLTPGVTPPAQLLCGAVSAPAATSAPTMETLLAQLRELQAKISQ